MSVRVTDIVFPRLFAVKLLVGCRRSSLLNGLFDCAVGVYADLAWWCLPFLYGQVAYVGKSRGRGGP